MTTTAGTSKQIPVILAAALLVVLAGTLGARLIARDQSPVTLEAPSAYVPEPKAFVVQDLEVPCWSCPSANDWPLRFQTDLDLLAPLGTGTANAAEWFGLFAKDVGPRARDAQDAAKRGAEGPQWLGTVLPPDDPLLLEAEPWVDQATMKYYPEIFPLEGYATRITNLLFQIKLVRSWIARGEAAEDSDAAMADFRRAIRLGRLLRQEDTVIISDLVGLACIHLGTRGVYGRALADGDLETALLASVVLGEVPAQRLGTKQRLTSTDLMQSMRLDNDGEIDFKMQPGRLDTVIDTAQNAPDRRFRLEAILGLNMAKDLGTPEESARAVEALEALADANDLVILEAARWSRDNALDENEIKEWAVPANQ